MIEMEQQERCSLKDERKSMGGDLKQCAAVRGYARSGKMKEYAPPLGPRL